MSNERSQRRVVCLVCDRQITLNNFTHHVRSRHPERADEARNTLWAEIGANNGRALPALRPVPAAVQLPPLGVEDLDAIVLGVVEQLAEPSGLIPVAHLPALFVWREATATFLRSVRE